MDSTFRIGPIVDPVFYIEGRNAIPSFTGPFRSMQELFDALIQKILWDSYCARTYEKEEDKSDNGSGKSNKTNGLTSIQVIQTFW